MNKIIFITGATSGIGKATAEIFAKNGANLVLTGRRKEKLSKIANSLTNTYNVEVLPLCFDVSKKQEVTNAIVSLPEKWQSIDVLVNNAGLALGLDKIQEGNVRDWDTMIDTNVKGLLYVSHEIIPLLIKNKKGHIINIGSTAARAIYEKGNVYCATKFAVDALSKTMRVDLLEHQIKVTQILPGAAETEFSNVRFKGDNNKADSVYKGYEPLTAEDIADTIYYVTTLPPHVCINELEITALAQANSNYFYKSE
ncbi:SDR family NAD(P)-dependent oxidoreductase [Leptobacterium sp. I13]|uniref:SDR family NAD(P)-dependent oxidoreductase n=1 Tax=Leptobacterium meishanense TaxID=3128904 RepID=UPI0030EBD2E8